MVLNWSGEPATPDSLAVESFTPGRRGSLQTDLSSAARRHRRVPYRVADLDSLLREIDAGHPVIVLQNLSFSWAPRWHWAVAIGYDLDRGTLVFHSGKERARTITLELFERTWRRGDHWALVVLPASALPASARERSALQAVVAFERVADPADAATAYLAITERWPESIPAWMGLGNTRYAASDLAAAEAAFLRAIQLDPGAAPAFNNLAQVLLERGHAEQARVAALRALELGGTLTPTYRETLEAIDAD